MDSAKRNAIHQRLQEIDQLAHEIEEVPNLPQDMWTMRKIDEKARQIMVHSRWIQTAIGTGSGGTGSGTGPG